MDRVVRVHLAEVGSTFVIVSRYGQVVDVSLETQRWVVGRPDRVVAGFYRRRGASFVDLLAERAVVRVARGYRSRDTSVRPGDSGLVGRVQGGPVREATRPPGRVAHGRDGDPVASPPVDGMAESLRLYKEGADMGGEFPF